MACVIKENMMKKLMKRVKMDLISRDVEKQMKALDFLTNKLDSRQAEIVINSDVPELLCDIISNRKSKLIKSVFNCLLEMAKYQIFHEQSHSAAVLECTCRTLKMLANDATNWQTIYPGIKLMTNILTKFDWSTGGFMVDHIIHLAKKLLVNDQFQNIHLHVIRLVLFLSKRDNHCNKNLPLIIYHSLKIFILLLENNKQKLKNTTKVAAEFIIFSLRCSSLYNGSLINENQEMVRRLIHDFIVPVIKAEVSQPVNPNLMISLLTCLLSACKYFDLKTSSELTKLLLSEKFLTSLPEMGITLKSKSVHKTSMLLLSAMMRKLLSDHSMTLSEEELKIILKGYQFLEPGVYTWIKLLDQEQYHKIYHSVIIYFYFLFLTCNSLYKMPDFLPHICRFVKSQSSCPSPALLKAVILLLAASSVSKEANRTVVRANATLVSWVRSVPLVDVYTHHPALLMWAFSAFVNSKKFQINLLTLWLKQKDCASRKIIETLALKNSEVAFCLLDLVKTGQSEDVTLQALDVLRVVSSRDKAQKYNQLSNRIWLGLRETLSTLSSPHSSQTESNVSCVVYLACGLVPSCPDTLLIMRITYQLLKAFHQPINDQTLYVQLLKLADTILTSMAQAKDLRVVQMLCGDEVLLRSLVTTLRADSDHRPATLPAIRLLSHLHYLQNVHCIKVKTTMLVSGEILLQLLATHRSAILLATLQLSNLMLMSSKVKPLICLPPSTANCLIQTLYLDFQNLTLKHETGDLSWRFQTSMLAYCKIHNKELFCHLLTEPYTSMAVRLALKTNGVNNQVVLEFLSEWLSGLHLYKMLPLRSPKALRPCRLAVTLNDVTSSLVSDTLSQAFSNLHISVGSKILLFKTNIEARTMNSLQEKVKVLNKNANSD